MGLIHFNFTWFCYVRRSKGLMHVKLWEIVTLIC